MPQTLSETDRSIVNNAYYDSITSWWDDSLAPVALLRAEGRLKNAWVVDTLKKRNLSSANILDVGCGGGFLTNELSMLGHKVTGMDLSEESLVQAAAMDSDKKVAYIKGDAYQMPFKNGQFDVVTCFDFLEHVSEPAKVITEVARVLAPNGLFFYHTFNRNWLAHLIAIKGVEWFVNDTPKDLHVIDLFIKPRELQVLLTNNGMVSKEERGIRPVLNSAFLKLLRQGQVESDFRFKWTDFKGISYAGLAERK